MTSETTTNLQLDDSEYHIYNLATTRRYSALTISANCNGTITLSPLHRVKQRQTYIQPSNDPSLFRTNDIRQLSRHDNAISTSRSETTTKLQLHDSECHMYNLATTRHYSALTTSANCRGTITLSLLHGVKLRQTYS
ncbi:hypothetical protein J6590_045307 [Homalodisca vitripennis]|nr:hypothetical protein J6590_045307 [Homalodisca vitripennis]